MHSETESIHDDNEQIKQLHAMYEEKQHECSALIRDLSEAREASASKDNKVAKIARDLSIVGDAFKSVLSAKERERPEPARVIVKEYITSEPDERLQFEFDTLKVTSEEAIATRDTRIKQLEDLVKTASETKPRPCSECRKLMMELETKKNAKADESSMTDVVKLQNRISQLEILIRSTEEEKRDVTIPDERVQTLQHELTETDAIQGKITAELEQQKSIVRSIRVQLEEKESIERSASEAENEYRMRVDKIEMDQRTMIAEIRHKKQMIETTTEKLAESQQTIREPRILLEKSREDAQLAREERFSRTSQHW